MLSFEASMQENDGVERLWLRSDESANVEALGEIVAEWLDRTGQDRGIGIEYANTCSKLRPDGFGGGAMWITREGVESMNSQGWLSDRAKGAEAASDPSP
jgi:hypothetical protein